MFQHEPSSPPFLCHQKKKKKKDKKLMGQAHKTFLYNRRVSSHGGCRRVRTRSANILIIKKERGRGEEIRSYLSWTKRGGECHQQIRLQRVGHRSEKRASTKTVGTTSSSLPQISRWWKQNTKYIDRINFVAAFTTETGKKKLARLVAAHKVSQTTMHHFDNKTAPA